MTSEQARLIPVEAAVAHFASAVIHPDVPSHGQTDVDRKAGRFTYRENLEAGQALIAALHRQSEQIKAMREAIQDALHCTPMVRLDPADCEHRIVYDCGDPWKILRTAAALGEG